MAHITLLDSSTVNQIAAGEVIERPSSVVKELLENAIDAGATAITVEIKEGGISFIRVTDNGSGIPKEEIPLAFLRHSTSKIRRVEDLLTVSSLGFRGEALSSIAAVAQVELITKTEDQLTGSRYVIEGGEEKTLEEIGAPGGTTIVVRNLFFNTPARRKFLKSAQTEGGYISSLAERIALSHPEISFRFLMNGQNRLHTAGNHKLKDIVYTVYGREITSQLITAEAWTEDGCIGIHGFLGKPLISRGNRSYENYFINGRYIKSGLITKAIENAYAGFVMQHKYPFTVLHFTIESSWLDVNVHPTKMELRFRNEELVYRTVYEAVRNALEGKELIPQVTLDVGKEEKNRKNEKPDQMKLSRERGPEPFEVHRQAVGNEEKAENEAEVAGINAKAAESMPSGERLGAAGEEPRQPAMFREKTDYGTLPPGRTSGKDTVPWEPSTIELMQRDMREEGEGRDASPVPVAEAPKQMELFEEKILTRKVRDEYHVIGQLFDTYWLIQYRDQFLMIDQHAAHEKVLFERTMRSLANKEYTIQQMNPPIVLSLSAREEAVLSEYKDQFQSLGFEIEPFGGKEYAVYGVPGNLFGLAREDLLMEMLDSLADEAGHRRLNLVEEKVALMSCKAAVKGNNRLSFAEAEALIDELMELDHPYTCPHGRPTIISMTKHELEKKFKRVVS
ncbi:DNA mismatch repair endonuclease MutL [Cuneatibacter sp. NSJ-177]|uniref:DNA mismatch repair endonuclease MutL n=1 Tax=Cuneatibacter sp. NSJ-177 TaxID=2931401 RepID=UPI001FD384E4|nr:DNA mismatch repair endonuclease MutL [Cuneatibacter sp. NSJ-177]MCJ7836433.1 DNA mismatch repair endonuclease MutL [Cuneatibacter sp. NSJ-177]